MAVCTPPVRSTLFWNGVAFCKISKFYSRILIFSGISKFSYNIQANTRSSEKIFFAARPKKYTSAINISYDDYGPLKHPYNDFNSCLNRSLRRRFRSHARARRFNVVYAPFSTLLRRLQNHPLSPHRFKIWVNFAKYQNIYSGISLTRNSRTQKFGP